MAEFDIIAFNIAAFISGLFVLEFGADKFIDNTAKLAARLNVSPTLIALLTSGAEWEELVVVVAAISQHQSSLAIGNIIGSYISNILGAFSLGLIFYPSSIKFDKSSKIYTTILLIITTLLSIFILFFESLGRIVGATLIAVFGTYVASIAYAIYQGIMEAPENDSDSDSDTSSDERDFDETSLEKSRSPIHSSNTRLQTMSRSNDDYENLPPRESFEEQNEGTSLKDNFKIQRKTARSIINHIVHLTLGLLALSLSGYILSHSLSSLATTLSLSTTVLGTTILSIATTLPEKLIAILSGKKRQGGIIIANTTGSNIFLLTLCAGVLFLAGDLKALRDSVGISEVAYCSLKSNHSLEKKPSIVVVTENEPQDSSLDSSLHSRFSQCSLPLRYAQRVAELLWKFAKFTGPGAIISVAYIDPDNYQSDLSAGAKFKSVLANSLFQSCAILGGNLMPHTIYLGSGLVQARMREFDHQNEKYHETRTSDSRFAIMLYRPTLSAIKSCMTYTIAELCITLFVVASFVNSAILIVAAASLSEDANHDADLQGMYYLFVDTIGQAAGTFFAVGLLFSGVSAGIVATMAGQLICEGAMEWRVSPFCRRLVTRLVSIGPAVVVAVAMGERGLAEALNACNVVLSVSLIFVTFPLVWYTCCERYMRVGVDDGVDYGEGNGGEVGNGNRVVGVLEGGLRGVVRDAEGGEMGRGEGTVSLANGWVVTGVGWLLWFVIAGLNVALLTFLGLGIGGDD
ncbi:transporter smf2 [Sclerotinia borealis F-4128]|uniref:Transporter smf2 n=1 Tax=Sclerotinia borealis (strain F-4128) TaxID=1432307 RepID=W9CMB2_SCLBF|nr:transporter smf2 [Sclerotinia borealis F-4128]